MYSQYYSVVCHKSSMLLDVLLDSCLINTIVSETFLNATSPCDNSFLGICVLAKYFRQFPFSRTHVSLCSSLFLWIHVAASCLLGLTVGEELNVLVFPDGNNYTSTSNTQTEAMYGFCTFLPFVLLLQCIVGIDFQLASFPLLRLQLLASSLVKSTCCWNSL